jgi:hypothetical protein
MRRIIPFVIILLFLAVAAIVFLFKDTLFPNDVNGPTPTPTVTITPTPTPTAEVPADWESYTSEELGFTISHPPDMEVGQTQVGSIEFMLTGPTQTPQTDLFDGIRITIITDEYEGQFRRFVEAERQRHLQSPVNPDVGNIEETTVASIQGLQFSLTTITEIEQIYLSLDNNRYALITKFVADPEEEGFEETADLMLSTLEFDS